MRLDRKTLVSVLTFLVAVGLAWYLGSGGDEAGAPSGRPLDTSVATDVVERTAPAGLVAPPGFETIAVDELPAEARATLALIDAGGPYPYDADDEVFQNRERVLPTRPTGYYREYTVETPGSDDRGARRIVMGEEGDVFYTDDHYDSFRWVER